MKSTNYLAAEAKFIFVITTCLLFMISCEGSDPIQVELTTEHKPLQGKKIVCFGPSGTERGYFVEVLPELLGGTFYNMGIGGTSVCSRKGNSPYQIAWSAFNLCEMIDSKIKNDYSHLEESAVFIFNDDGHDYRDKVKLLKSIDFKDIDLVLIFQYGGNEFSDNVDVGDVDSFDKTTFCGGLNISLDLLLSNYPHIRIITFATGYRWLTEDGQLDTDNKYNGINLYTKDYSDACVAVSHRWHCPSFNMYEIGGFNKYNHHLYYVDGSHFNVAGGRKYAETVAALIKTVYF